MKWNGELAVETLRRDAEEAYGSLQAATTELQASPLPTPQCAPHAAATLALTRGQSIQMRFLLAELEREQALAAKPAAAPKGPQFAFGRLRASGLAAVIGSAAVLIVSTGLSWGIATGRVRVSPLKLQEQPAAGAERSAGGR